MLESERLRDQEVQVGKVAEVAYEFIERVVSGQVVVEKIAHVRFLAPISDLRGAAIEREIRRRVVGIDAVEETVARGEEAPQVKLGSGALDGLRNAAHGMPEFVEEGGHPLRAGGELGADADEAVGS